MVWRNRCVCVMLHVGVMWCRVCDAVSVVCDGV